MRLSRDCFLVAGLRRRRRGRGPSLPCTATCTPARTPSGQVAAPRRLTDLVADADGGGKVVVVEVTMRDSPGFYRRRGFMTTGIAGELVLYMKVSTAR